MKRKARKEGTKPIRTVGYIRVSSKEQAEEGISLEVQRAKLEAYAGLYDLDMVIVLADEGKSAGNLRRPGVQEALRMLRDDEADAILVYHLDRLTRRQADLAHLLDKYFEKDRWQLMSVTQQLDTRTAAGRMVINVLGSVLQWQREDVGEKTSVALQHKMAKGEAIGGPAPFGHRKIDGPAKEDGTILQLLEAIDDEQAIIRQARRLRASGLSLRKIASKLEVDGHLSRDGRPFHPMQVRRMVA